MRADMGKVLVERPRINHADQHLRKGYRRQAAKDLAAGDGPTREGMKARTPRSKYFNEHLSPLRRFLDSNVGRPWDKVHAEIRAHVDPGNLVQKHVLTHLYEYVVTEVEEIDGEPFDARPRSRFFTPAGRSLRTSDRPQWYVCPRSGLLRRSRILARKVPRKCPPPPYRRVRVSDTEMCLEIDGRWELVTLQVVADGVPRDRAFDLVRRRDISVTESIQLYGVHAVATARRALSRAAQKRLPIPIDWVK